MGEEYKLSNQEILKVIEKVSEWGIHTPHDKKLAEIIGFIKEEQDAAYLMINITEKQDLCYDISIIHHRARLNAKICEKDPEFSKIERILADTKEKEANKTIIDVQNMKIYLAKLINQ